MGYAVRLADRLAAAAGRDETAAETPHQVVQLSRRGLDDPLLHVRGEHGRGVRQQAAIDRDHRLHGALPHLGRRQPPERVEPVGNVLGPQIGHVVLDLVERLVLDHA